MSALIDEATNVQLQHRIHWMARELMRYIDTNLKGWKAYVIESTLAEDEAGGDDSGKELFGILDYIAERGYVWDEPNAIWAIAELISELETSIEIGTSDLDGGAGAFTSLTVLHHYMIATAMAGRLLALAVDTRKQLVRVVDEPENSDVIR